MEPGAREVSNAVWVKTLPIFSASSFQWFVHISSQKRLFQPAMMMRAASQSSAYTVVEEQSGAGASDFRDVEMASDGSDSGTADFGMGSAVVGEARKRKKTSPAQDMGGDLQSYAAGDLWKAVCGFRRWEENARSNIERKRKIDLAAFVEVSLAIERAYTKMEAREAFLVGRLAERSEIKDVVADEVQRAWA